jgi:hypothetical protein
MAEAPDERSCDESAEAHMEGKKDKKVTLAAH